MHNQDSDKEAKNPSPQSVERAYRSGDVSPALSDDDPDYVEGSARQTTANLIRHRRYLRDELASLSDVAIDIAVAVAAHRTCFIRDCGLAGCTGCEDIIAWAKEIDTKIIAAALAATGGKE